MRTRNSNIVLGVSATAMILAGATSAFAADAPPSPGSPQTSGAPPSSGSAQSTNSGAATDDIVVTALKRNENINNVGMAITAASGDSLRALGVVDTSQLAKIEPSFVFVQSSYGTPVYSIRGVGFYDTALGATPTVTVYLDQVPIPYSIMTRSASMDVERVEILKGPQGTLFGANATGGAINYVANKPTDSFAAGGSLSYGRFNSVGFSSYLSGPLAPTLSARLAVQLNYADPWQKSYTRSDRLGTTKRGYARLLLDWKPTDRLTVELNVNGGIDRSDTQAGQLVAITNAGLGANITHYPLPPANARAADWDPTANPRRRDSQYQFAANISYDLSPGLVLRSITSYQYYRLDLRQDDDGTTYQLFTAIDKGTIKAFSEELRLEGKSFNDRVSWILGGNYSRDLVYDSLASNFRDGRYGLAGINGADAVSDQRIRTFSGYGNAEFKLTDRLSAQLGGRYSSSTRNFSGCTYDTGDGTDAAYTSRLIGHPGLIPPGGCATLNASFLPAVVVSKLQEDNFSWRAGLSWKVVPGSLLYASVSRGYKDGAYPTAGATVSAGLIPAKQESLLAYEAGFKLALADRRLQLNGAVFYYDYSDKQIRGRIVDPIFGSFNRLINIPKSHEIGAELDIKWRPIDGLTLSAGGTYLDSHIEGPFVNLDALGVNRDLSGNPYPYTPKWSGVAGIDYKRSVGNGLNAFVGADVNYQNVSYAGLGEVPLFKLNERAVANVRAGVESSAGKWTFTLWADNVTNKHYWNNVLSVTGDDVIRFAAMPVTFGGTFGWKF